MKAIENQKRVQTTIMLDHDLRRKIRRAAADNDVHISDIVNDAVRLFLDDRKSLNGYSSPIN